MKFRAFGLARIHLVARWLLCLILAIELGHNTMALASGAMAPIFQRPEAVSVKSVVDFVGRDQDLLTRMDLGPQAVEARLRQIQAGERKLQALGQKSREAMVAGTELIDLYVMQAMYLENMRGLGLSDKRYPDLGHFTKVWRSKVVTLGRKLVKDYPQSALTRRWRVASIESAMRLGDDAVFTEVSNLLKNDGSAPDAVRLRALGVALSQTGGTQRNYGTVQSVLALELDNHSAAALKLILAERESAKNPSSAMRLYQEAARDGLGIKRPGGGSGPITSHAASRLLDQALSSKPKEPNAEVVNFFESMGLPGHLKFYLERCALLHVPSRPRDAVEGYEQIASLSATSPEERYRVQLRALDIVLAAGALSDLEERWQKITQTSEKMRGREVEERVAKTQNLVWTSFNKKPTGALAEQLARLHDGFEKSVPSYGSQSLWKVRVLEALFKSAKHQEVSSRADRYAREIKEKGPKTAVLRLSARSKEKLLGVSDSPSFAPEAKINGGSDLVMSYVGVLKELIPLVEGEERQKAAYQMAYLTYAVNGPNQAKADFAKTIGAYPTSKFAPRAASLLLSDGTSSRDHVFVEALARSLEKWRVQPSDKRFANLRAVIEVAVFQQAKALEEASKHSEAADKYVAFQKEFPQSKNADIALHQASRNYTSAKQIDKSIAQMEKLLEAYPKSSLAKETRWSAAEQSKSIGQLLRSANHYSAFATQHPKDGNDRKAWVLAAELHKGLGRFSHAISSYEQHLASATAKDDKVTAAREIASLQHKYGATPDALASYDRVIKIAGSSKDEAWARFHTTEILLRQGLEREARGEARKLLAVSASDDETQKQKTKIRYSVGRLDASALLKQDPMSDAKLFAATQNLIKRYDEVKIELMSPCEVSGHEFCAVGYFEVAKLAEGIASRLLTVKPPPTIDPAEANRVTSLVQTESERLAEESKAYASQAEGAIAQGVPDSETAELIRAYSQRARGRDPVGLPD
jgi:tetratricopeptide (TPR) repeat protein